MSCGAGVRVGVILGGSRGGTGPFSGSFGVSLAVSGGSRVPSPGQATARERISQFAEANSMRRWFRFLVIPR